MRTSLLSALLLVLLSFFSAEAAKRCYSGQNARFAEKQCSAGSMATDFTCQKFVCEGGKSPFTLRTCGQRNMGCLAGPRICQFSGGRGSCKRCDGELCNM
ncbi:hypothetical protein M3Y99_01218000 [Aphelenchoides fujianensis]|nr:hypothetical protein M3Y99_01218000 [Aphelenchoides fujianensis]